MFSAPLPAVRSWLSSFQNCTTCRNFGKPCRRRDRSNPSNPDLGFVDISISAETGCLGCAVLRDVLKIFVNAERAEDMWIRTTAPSHLSSLYRLYTNGYRYFEIYRVNEKAPFPAIPVVRHVSGNTCSDGSIRFAQDQLKQCIKQHRRCRKPSQYATPKRLLALHHVDVENNNGHVVLVETSSAARARSGFTSDYACLSHCWGTKQILTTTALNLDEHLQGIRFDKLPLTFQHATIIARKLGVHWIWIDSLCIIQGSVKSDWEEESGKMGAYYGGGLFTIAAAMSTGADSGCFAQAAPEYSGTEIPVSVKGRPAGSVWVRKLVSHGAYYGAWPLTTRGWVYQERLLSRRVIHFTGEEVIFECLEGTACECGHALSSWTVTRSLDSKAKRHAELSSASVTRLGELWRGMVTTFSTLKLSFGDDALPALSGLAKEIESRGLYGYLGGMWRTDLDIDLLWSVRSQWLKGTHRLRTWRAPSWCWPSVSNIIYYETSHGRAINRATVGESHIKILAADVEPAGADPYGKVKYGKLTLQGKLAAVRYDVEGPHVRVGENSEVWLDWDRSWIEDCGHKLESSRLHLLQMATTKRYAESDPDWIESEAEMLFLVLLRIDDLTNTFRRVGFASRLFAAEVDWFRDADEIIHIE